MHPATLVDYGPPVKVLVVNGPYLCPNEACPVPLEPLYRIKFLEPPPADAMLLVSLYNSGPELAIHVHASCLIQT